MMIEHVAKWMWQRKYRKWHRIARQLYDGPEELAFAFLGEGAQLLEIVAVGEGETVGFVHIEPNDDGTYDIHVEQSNVLSVDD